MAKKPDSGKRVMTNPLVSRLLEAGSENAITLTGFVAPAGRKGYIRLILGLNDMSRSIEIAESDICRASEIRSRSRGHMGETRRGVPI